MGYLRFLTVLAVFAGAALSVSSQARAEAFVDIFNTDLPVYEGIPQESFQAQGLRYEKRPMADDGLAYEIMLPKVWKESKSFGYSLSKDIFTEIGRYVGPVKFNKASSYIVIQALDVGLQASAKTMAAAHFMENGFTVQGAQASTRNDVETLHVEVDKGESYVVRSKFMMNGGRLIMASYYLPATSWDEERDLQYRVMQSFRLLNEVDVKITDSIKYEFWDVATTSYPSGWEIQVGEDQSFDHMNILLLNYEGDIKKQKNLIINGRITLDLISRYVMPSLDDVLVDQVDLMISQGIVMKRKKEDFDAPVWPESFKNVSATVYEVLDSYNPNQQMELWIVGAQALGYYYVSTLVTPTRDEDFMIWGENTEALQYMIEHLVPGEEF